jgi:glycosyltransferase involved in cell wall biosynthesis
MEFSVSVIIPVYNGESYIEKAIVSALDQPEVLEVIIVNDGSTDNTEEILNKFLQTNQKVKVYYHENKSNKGRSASRNLGITKSKGNYIAFLDADDYYLSNRFYNDKLLFLDNNSLDGVYNAIGVDFYRESTQEERDRLKLTTVKKSIKPETLFNTLFNGGSGYFSIDGLTVRVSVFSTVGYFDTRLQVAEDTQLFFKMALKCCLVSGLINKPVAIRGVHADNVFTNNKLYSTNIIKMYETLAVWCYKNQVKTAVIDSIFNRIWVLKSKEQNKLFKDILYWGVFFLSELRLLFSIYSIKYFPIVRYRQKLFPLLYKRFTCNF